MMGHAWEREAEPWEREAEPWEEREVFPAPKSSSFTVSTE